MEKGRIRFWTIFIGFLSCLLVVCFAVVVPKFLTDSSVVGEVATIDNSTNESSKSSSSEAHQSNIKLYVNEQFTQKSLGLSDKTLSLDFEVVITNVSGGAIDIIPSEFSSRYECSGLEFLSFACTSAEGKQTLLTNQKTTLNFKLTYLIVDNSAFSESEDYNLAINYCGEEVYSITL